jgi:hypothetical protein
MNEKFDIPVVFIIFKRLEKSKQILSRIAQVEPSKIYLISDEGRNEEERSAVMRCRAEIEAAITWECTIIKDYAEENKGCFDRIGLGALRVFKQEKWAIFLEDDNLPELSFFYYCRDLLKEYERDDRVLWICGTNYLEQCAFESGADYGFTQHMLPCGWASWSEKFTKCYDKDFSLYTRENKAYLKKNYCSKSLFRKDSKNWERELSFLKEKGRFASWDYQMCFSLRMHNKMGIMPKYNQIENIGVDSAAAHGGTTFNAVMTQRFCGMKSHPLTFPLKHPNEVEIDPIIEKRLEKIILPPVEFHPVWALYGMIHKLLKVPDNTSIRSYLAAKRHGKG